MPRQARRSARHRAVGKPADVAPRAPRRAGARTTLRVPDDLAETIVRYAEKHRTSPNDALVRLALDGAERYERRREIDELADERRTAIDEMLNVEVDPDAEPISGEEIARAILGYRLGLYDEEIYGA